MAMGGKNHSGKRDHFRFRNPWKKTQKPKDECLEQGHRKRSEEVWEDLRGTEDLEGTKGQCPLPLVYPSHSSTYLHDKLAGIGSCHGGALPRQDPHRPDVESGRPSNTPAQHPGEARREIT